MAVSGEIAMNWLEMASANARRFASLLDSDIADLHRHVEAAEGLRRAEELKARTLDVVAQFEQSRKPTEERNP